jgi:hypothetical protein
MITYTNINKTKIAKKSETSQKLIESTEKCQPGFSAMSLLEGLLTRLCKHRAL